MRFNQMTRFVMEVFVAAFLLAGLAGTAIAQEKGKAVTKVLAENEKIRAWETRYKPGDENTISVSSATRVLRVLEGGTLLWTWPDGKAEKRDLKAGQVMLMTPGPTFTSKNIGASDVVLYVVMAK